MTQRLAFVFRQENCVGCDACTVACQANRGLAEDRLYRQVEAIEYLNANGRQVQAFLSQSCHHCEIPACLQACGYGVYSRREDGIVRQHLQNCVGCGHCVSACPYGAIKMEQKDGRQLATKCDMCAGRIAEGEKPHCVSGCPVQVLDVMPLEEAVRLPGAQLHGHGYYDKGTQPNTVIIKHRS
ncbi:4Fe-4S dicluster domain-containing protein [Ferrimonas marina]|uniref:Fe-S-cluster-containing dehydrogenase component n=1 Tax=Ferrimonas marina TaxID=299255 RepID=A0A1M5XUE2_9GAMM|nr:4Fe-4S dicluster domain-containing protein [Ferrimonas marina]SHI03359.1 Fe-S-cluster-containing dehydrogenase component [Ferrimonas marina]